MILDKFSLNINDLYTPYERTNVSNRWIQIFYYGGGKSIDREYRVEGKS